MGSGSGLGGDDRRSGPAVKYLGTVRAIFKGMRMKRFVIVSQQRSGSTLLVRSLDAHPGIVAADEVFIERAFDADGNPRFYRYVERRASRDPGAWVLARASRLAGRSGRRIPGLRTAQRGYRQAFTRVPYFDRIERSLLGQDRLVEDFLNDYFERNRSASAVGFKIMANQLDLHPKVVELIYSAPLAVIHCIRRNSLKMLVSRATSAARGVAHSTESVATTRVRLDTRHLREKLARIQCGTEKVRGWFSSQREYVEVFYEDMQADLNGTLGGLVSFLGVSPGGVLESGMKKLNPDDLREILLNYEEVEQALAGTRFERLLVT